MPGTARQLEALHTAVVDLQVPGVLAGLVLPLIDKTEQVANRAQAITNKLPATSEAIATAGLNTATRHQALADTTADLGHARPASAAYHDE